MSRPPAILPNDTVINDRYRIEKFVGAGGFASVYKSHDLLIERDVAIKVLNVHALGTGDEEHAVNLRRFRQEAKAAARIKHPTVVTIYDIGATSEHQQPFIVMEFLSGASLKKELAQNGPMAPARVQRLLIPCLEALGEGHELGIIHKDLKPGNLFLTKGGTADERLRLLDYGVARLQDESRAMTMGNQVVGTVAYLAPEYLVQQRVSPQLDVYQAGLILAEMLMGERVVVEDDVLAAANRHRFAELELAAPILAGPLAPVLARALARDPDARYDHCDAFADALKAVDLSGLAALERGGPRARLASIMAPPEETADMDGGKVDLRVREELGPTSPMEEPPRELVSAPTEALDASELFSRTSEPRETQAIDSEEFPEPVIAGPDGDDPWAGETLAMEMPAHVVAEYDARVEAERAARSEIDDDTSSGGAFGLVLAAGAALLALLVLIAVVLGMIFFVVKGDDTTERPVPEAASAPVAEAPSTPVGSPDSEPDVGEAAEDAGGEPGVPAADAGVIPDDAGAQAENGEPGTAVADAGSAPETPGEALDIELRSSPAGATVYDDKKKKLGQTPLTLRIPDAGVELTFKARGYYARKVKVKAADAPTFRVTLKKRRAAADPGIGIAQ